MPYLHDRMEWEWKANTMIMESRSDCNKLWDKNKSNKLAACSRTCTASTQHRSSCAWKYLRAFIFDALLPLLQTLTCHSVGTAPHEKCNAYNSCHSEWEHSCLQILCTKIIPTKPTIPWEFCGWKEFNPNHSRVLGKLYNSNQFNKYKQDSLLY